MATKILWHESHNTVSSPGSTKSDPLFACKTCGVSNGRGDTHEPCKPSGYFSKSFQGTLHPFYLRGRGDEEVQPMPDRDILARLKQFYTKEWCKCDDGAGEFSIGYNLCRLQYFGLFCIACDSQTITGSQHCHCGACGGITQTG